MQPNMNALASVPASQRRGEETHHLPSAITAGEGDERPFLPLSLLRLPGYRRIQH